MTHACHKGVLRSKNRQQRSSMRPAMHSHGLVSIFLDCNFSRVDRAGNVCLPWRRGMKLSMNYQNHPPERCPGSCGWQTKYAVFELMKGWCGNMEGVCRLDFKRVARSGVVGATLHGPYFSTGKHPLPSHVIKGYSADNIARYKCSFHQPLVQRSGMRKVDQIFGPSTSIPNVRHPPPSHPFLGISEHKSYTTLSSVL